MLHRGRVREISSCSTFKYKFSRVPFSTKLISRGSRVKGEGGMWRAFLGLFLLSVPLIKARQSESIEKSEEVEVPKNPKLVLILLDGFRWDYYEREKTQMEAFSQFLADGVQAEYLETVFPSLSVPAWTTVSTGLWPESHGLIGNYMYDLNEPNSMLATFSLDDDISTGRPKWWGLAEPIWITATRFNRPTLLRHWSRCDVSYDELKPASCSPYKPSPGIESLQKSLKIAVRNLQTHDFIMIQCDHLDNVGHKFGPNSREIKEALKEVDDAFKDFMDDLLDNVELDSVNVVIVGDHGMVDTSNSVYVDLERFLDKKNVYKSIGRGGAVGLATYPRDFEAVLNSLNSTPGIDVYKRSEIPEEWHYKKGRLTHEILVVAKPGFVIRGLQSLSKQIPKDPPEIIWKGSHGFPPEQPDMRTIFFARGPAFKKGEVGKPIRLVDVYQILAKVLEIPPKPNNGTWAKVAGLMNESTPKSRPTFLYFILLLISFSFLS